MTLADWEDEVKKVSDEDLCRYRHAIGTLKEWPTFKRKFTDEGIFTLFAILDVEGMSRNGVRQY